MLKSAKPMPAQASRSSKNSPIPSAIKKTSSATQILPQQAQGMETNYCSLQDKIYMIKNKPSKTQLQ